MRARDYQPGEQVPGTVYKVLRLIGAGGMGTVYDVEDTSIGKRYVLKTLHPKLGNREDLARRIQHEARTLARLNHPNIVEVITAGVTSDDLRLPYYLMERLSGQSLRLVLEKKGQLELPHAYHIGIDLLDALDHAHDKGVIHRDVKPDNIFLHRTVAGITVTKLLDFGIVSMLDNDTGETAGRFLGTLRYAAPEQLRGDKPSPKTDVYSAALVVYEIVAGRGPFDDEGDGRRIAAAHMGKVAPPLSRFAPGVPKELEVLLAAALAKSPAMRPRDAFSFGASLRNLKRMLEGVRPHETTESRITASALAPESVPAIAHRTTDGGVSPSPPEASSPRGDGFPRTTLAGMPLASIGPVAPSPGDELPSATTATEMDRVAATNTLLTSSLATPPAAPRGTEFTQAPTEDLARPPIEAPSPSLVWPPARSIAPSIEPNVRSVRAAPAGPSRPSRPTAAIGLAAAGMALLAASAVSVARRAGSAAIQADSPRSSVTASIVRGTAGIDLAMPAPTLAPPAFDAPSPSPPPAAGAVETAARASGAPVPAPSTTSQRGLAAPSGPAESAAHASIARPPHASAPASTPVAKAAPARTVDRPGPGF
jgi:serine/threonine-protein kinase